MGSGLSGEEPDTFDDIKTWIYKARAGIFNLMWEQWAGEPCRCVAKERVNWDLSENNEFAALNKMVIKGKNGIELNNHQ